MTKITDIYNQYKIMPNLQDHQLRVASVAGLICDSLDVEVDKESIIKACLLHDMGNIIKFDLSYTEKHFPEFLLPQGLQYWQDIQNEYFEKYGKDEHEASIQIAHEIESNSSAVDLINCIDGFFVEKIAKENNIEQKICMYADNRVSPHSVVSIEERNIEAKKRYESHPHSLDEERRIFFMDNVNSIEKQIFSFSKIKPEDINDESIKIYFEDLKKFEI